MTESGNSNSNGSRNGSSKLDLHQLTTWALTALVGLMVWIVNDIAADVKENNVMTRTLSNQLLVRQDKDRDHMNSRMDAFMLQHAAQAISREKIAQHPDLEELLGDEEPELEDGE